MRPFVLKNSKMSDNNLKENINKTPEKMSRLAWPKAKYGAIIAIIVIIVISLILYKDIIFSFLK